MSREERWQLSGNAAEFYERYVRLLMEPWVQCLVDVAAPQPAEHVLDVACGTGFVARLAAERVGAKGRAVGIDLNPSMIEAARAASGQDAAGRIEWRTGDAGALPFENDVFDVVLCQQGVQFFPDRVHALREMRRVLRVGGRLAFTVWSAIGDTPYHAALADGLARHVSAEAVRPTIKTTKLPLPAEFVPGHLAALPMAHEIARLPAERRNALLQEITEALSAYVDGEQLVSPAGVHMVTADA